MSGLSRGVLVLLVLTSLIAGVTAVGVAAQEDSSTEDFQLTELEETGDQVGRAPPSTRWIGSSRVFIDYDWTNPLFRATATEPWQVQRFLRSGSTVQMNEIRMHWRGERGAANTSLDVHIIYWQYGTIEVEKNGTTVERTVPVNVTHVEKEVAFSGAFDQAEIELRPHYSEKYQVSMWIEGQEGARWRFEHKSLETSRQVPTNTAGERLWWLIKDFVVWLILFGFIGAGVSLWAIRRAGTGPMIGFFWWGVGIFFIGAISLLVNWGGIATLFIRGPKVLAFLVIGLITIPLLEGQDDRIKKIYAIKPTVTEGKLASGDDALDAIEFEDEIVRVTDTADGKHIRVNPGPIKFLARLAGGFAEIPRLRSKIKTEAALVGRTSLDSMVFIDHKEDEVAPYESEGFSIDLPTSRAGFGWFAIMVGGLGAIMWFTGIGSLWLLPIASLPFVLSVDQGHADLVPAEGHSRKAITTLMYLTKELKEADTLSESQKETLRERVRTAQEIDERVELRDETIVGEMLGGEIAATIIDEDDSGSELGEDDDDE